MPRLAGPAAVVLIGAGLALLPAARPPAFYESLMYLVFHWVALATSWTILGGFSGYFSFGHGAFFGAGVYAAASLLARGMPFLPALALAGLAAALLGIGMGAVVFRVRRLRGELFALLTLAVTFVLATIVLNTPIDGGPGIYLSGVPVPRIGGSPTAALYLLGLAIAAASIAAAWAVSRARWGAGLFAIHDDEDVAEVLGVPTYRYKLLALGLSSGLAGVAGAIHAMFVTYVTVAETFSIVVPLYVVLMSVAGGARHWLGPAVGATLVTVLMYGATGAQTAVAGRALVGLTLMLVILFLPGGLMGLVARRRAPRPAMTAPSAAAGPASPERVLPRHESGGGVGAPLLVLDGVRKGFRGVQALGGVSLEVRAGEILGLVGPNGSGKSTLINVISGHHRADAGRIRLDGVEVAGRHAHAIARLGVSRTYQIPRPFAHLTVRENVAVAAMFGRLGRGRRAAEREATRWLEFTGLADRADALPATLNLHQRKFLELARALASGPRLVMLDEVLSGLTPAEMASATRLVRQIRDGGATVVFVEHIMRAVMAVADRVVVLDAGRLIASGAPQEVMRDPAVVERYLGKTHA
jgi:branched-chain amino acid transport system permease protein